MSAKDKFFKKVQENNEAQQSNEERTKEDVKAFCVAVSELTTQVKKWLDGSGVQVIVTEISLHDDTVTPINLQLGRYDIASAKLQNGTKTAVLRPEWLYGFGVTGCVSLTIDTSRQQKYTLFMKTGNQQQKGWTLTRDGQKSPEGVMLTEETFFEAIDALA